jgi:hypothetical protein
MWVATGVREKNRINPKMLERKSKRPVGSFDKFEVKLSTGLLNGPITRDFTKPR